MEEEYQLGCINSPKDERDYLIELKVEELPSEYSLDIPSTKNQLSILSCVSHAISSINEYYYLKENNEKADFSVGFIYGHRPEGYYQGKGMILREALKTAQQVGNLPNYVFPVNEEVPKVKELVSEKFDSLSPFANHYKITNYAKVEGIDEIKKTIFQGIPVLISIPIYSWNFTPNLSGYIGKPNEEAKFRGNHAIVVLGWKRVQDKECLIILNSWGKLWGKNGLAYLSVEYPINEAWAVTDKEHSVLIRKPQLSILQKILYFLRSLF